MSVRQAKVITVTSVKGGTGKTTTVLNLAGILKMRKMKILIIDLDLYSGGIAVSLNVQAEHDLFQLMDDLNNNRFHNLEDYITAYDEYIDVIPSPKDPRTAGKINSKYLQVIYAKAKLKYDVILVDTNHNLNDLNLVNLDYSDQILYVITNDPVDLKNMRTMVSIYQDMDKKNYKIVLNEASDRQKDYFSFYDIKNIIKDNIDYTIPNSFYIKNIDKYVLDGHILTLDPHIRKKHKKGITHFEKMAQSILKEPKKEMEK